MRGETSLFFTICTGLGALASLISIFKPKRNSETSVKRLNKLTELYAKIFGVKMGIEMKAAPIDKKYRITFNVIMFLFFSFLFVISLLNQ